MRAKQFFYVCAGVLMLAVAYSLGAGQAQGQSPTNRVIGITDGTNYGNYIFAVTENGDWYYKSVCCAFPDTPEQYPWTYGGNILGGSVPVMLAMQTGLRVSELIGLRCCDVVLGTGAHVRCEGKGRKQRCTPLRRDTAAVVDAWLREQEGLPADPVFRSSRGGPLSRDAVEHIIARHTAAAQCRCPSLVRKHVTPHVLRHTAAMELLQHGVDRSVIALWLGHESMETTQMYLHADLQLKERALLRTLPVGFKPGRYRPNDQLLAFLEGL